MPSPTYQARAEAFAKAIDLGIAVYTQHPPRAVRGLPFPSAEKYAKESRFLAEDALAPEPAFANTKSLAYLEDAFFTFWNESHGPHIEAFWSSVAAAKLPFEPRDVVGGILERGSIRTRIEYEHAVDAEPDLPEARRAEISRLIGEYEQRSGAKARRASTIPLEEAAESAQEADGSTAAPTTAESAVIEATEAEVPKRTATKKAATKRAATKKAVAEAPVEEVATKKPAARKAATKKPAAKKAATKKVAAKKPAAKKAAKVATKKAAAKKPAAKKAAKKAATKKVAAKKPAAKKAATKKVAAKKKATKRPAAKKPATKKAPAKKPATKKPAIKKAPAKKVAAKKKAPAKKVRR